MLLIHLESYFWAPAFAGVTSHFLMAVSPESGVGKPHSMAVK